MTDLTRIFVVALALACSACLEPGEPVYGASFTDAQFEVYDPSVGVFPSEVVLEDPNNPFALASPSGVESLFEIEANDENDVTAFYGWASWLARQPAGESQYFAAVNLHEIWEAGNAPQADLPVVRDMALAGYGNVLEVFPNAFIYDESVTFTIELATPAYFAIVELGGTPPPGWVVVNDANGIPRAVRQ